MSVNCDFEILVSKILQIGTRYSLFNFYLIYVDDKVMLQ